MLRSIVSTTDLATMSSTLETYSTDVRLAPQRDGLGLWGANMQAAEWDERYRHSTESGDSAVPRTDDFSTPDVTVFRLCGAESKAGLEHTVYHTSLL